MKEEIAFELMKQLKKDGHPVSMADQPKMGPQAKMPGEDYYAIVGAHGMTKEAVKKATDVIRGALLEEHAPYTIEREGDKSRCFPSSSFAAW